MIKNDRQYRITKAAVTKFENGLRQLTAEGVQTPPSIDPVIRRAEREALKSQLDDLRSEVRQYEDLVAGKVGILDVGSLADLPQALVQTRIASGLSQKELADRLGIKEQQIQRYEATDYQQASLARLLEISSALHLNVRKDLLLPTKARSFGRVFSRLQDIGLGKDFVLNRLVPRDQVAVIADGGNEVVDRLLFSITRSVSHIFGWTAAAVLGEDRPWLDGGVLGAARFKVAENVEHKTLEVYTFYAHFLALLLLKATEDIPKHPIPTDPGDFCQAVVDRYGSMTFRSALLYCWDLGIPVLPLSDSGAFHGACWRVEGRNVIVLKQKTKSLARWLFDLLHEFRHAGEDPDSPSHSVVENANYGIGELDVDAEEEASLFAGEVTLRGKSEELTALCVSRSQGSIERLKTVVPKVASDGGVDPAALANYMAFRLSLQGENWWGAATNLQGSKDNPWEVARDVLLERTDLSKLSGLDRELFVQALKEPKS